MSNPHPKPRPRIDRTLCSDCQWLQAVVFHGADNRERARLCVACYERRVRRPLEAEPRMLGTPRQLRR